MLTLTVQLYGRSLANAGYGQRPRNPTGAAPLGETARRSGRRAMHTKKDTDALSFGCCITATYPRASDRNTSTPVPTGTTNVTRMREAEGHRDSSAVRTCAQRRIARPVIRMTPKTPGSGSQRRHKRTGADARLARESITIGSASKKSAKHRSISPATLATHQLGSTT